MDATKPSTRARQKAQNDMGPEDHVYRDAREKYEGGASFAQIARAVGFNHAIIANWANRDKWKRTLVAIDLPARNEVDLLCSQAKALAKETRLTEMEEDLSVFGWVASKVLLKVSGPQLIADAPKIKLIVDMVLNLTRGRSADISSAKGRRPMQLAMVNHFHSGGRLVDEVTTQGMIEDIQGVEATEEELLVEDGDDGEHTD
jgi:hypothetical protein